ncbi:MAG TPA: response regulator transcription factor [Nitrospiraceae bacterium]|nr:response regulator transcription factor [Nitrospiraceae bacterium]
MYKARLALADDHPLVLDGLRQLLEPDFSIVGTASNGKDLLDLAARTKPDVILLDVSMPDMNGYEAARRLKIDAPTAKIVFLTMLSEPIHISEGFRAGASGYVLKQSASDELRAAINSVLANKRYLSENIAPEVREVIEHEWLRPEGFTGDLTPRQREILVLLAKGCTTKQIAGELRISMKTVEFHKANITRKLGLHTISDLTKFALTQGMTSLHPQE